MSWFPPGVCWCTGSSGTLSSPQVHLWFYSKWLQEQLLLWNGSAVCDRDPRGVRQSCSTVFMFSPYLYFTRRGFQPRAGLRVGVRVTNTWCPEAGSWPLYSKQESRATGSELVPEPQIVPAASQTTLNISDLNWSWLRWFYQTLHENNRLGSIWSVQRHHCFKMRVISQVLQILKFVCVWSCRAQTWMWNMTVSL